MKLSCGNSSLEFIIILYTFEFDYYFTSLTATASLAILPLVPRSVKQPPQIAAYIYFPEHGIETRSTEMALWCAASAPCISSSQFL